MIKIMFIHMDLDDDHRKGFELMITEKDLR